MTSVRHVSALLIAAGLALPGGAGAAVLPPIGGTAGAGADTPVGDFDLAQTDRQFGAIGDVNADGKADFLAGRGAYPAPAPAPGAATVILGSASRAAITPASAVGRTWTLKTAWNTEYGPQGVDLHAAGDVTRDGRADVVAIPSDGYGAALPGANEPLGIIAPGPSGAGTTDLAAAGGPGLVRLTAPASEGLRRIADVAAAGDIDGDGFGDLVVVRAIFRGSPGVAVVLWGGPTLRGTIDLTAPGAAGFVISGPGGASGGGDLVGGLAALGDVNGDDLADVGVTAYNGAASHAYFVLGSRTRGGNLSLRDWQPRAARIGPVGGESGIVPIGDTDLDGFDDVVLNLGNKESVIIRGRAATRTMGMSSTFPRINWYLSSQGRLGDVNGDGRPDAVVEARDLTGTFDSGIPGLVLFGAAGTTGISVPRTGTPTTAGIRFGAKITGLGDVDGDGLADLGTPAGIVYGYGPGAQPPRDTTPPVLTARAGTDAGYGTCFFGTRYQLLARIWITVSEPATLEFTAVQGGTTRRATLGVNAGTEVKTGVPKSLFGPNTAPVALTITPVDAAGNRGTPVSLTHRVKNLGYGYACPTSFAEVS